ncbi:Olfactory receptor 19, partial [Heterocephalus glaber]
MEQENETQIYKIFLLGISENSTLQPFLFGLFLFMYLVTVLGSSVIILDTISDSHLHTPMYFFLSNLSLADISFTSTSIPKMLVNIQIHSKVITYEGCITQVYFFTLFGVLDSLLLTVMAYDHFVAICHPLHFLVIMNLRFCGLPVLVSWVTAALYSLLESLITSIYINNMKLKNYTQSAQFLLLGFSEDPELQPLLFGIFLSMYLATVLGNLLIVLATVSDYRLHTPMYFFLSNLSFMDTGFTSTTVPNMLVNIQTQSKVIRYKGCITQVYFFMLCLMLDSILLTVMSYDHYVAICHPLHYMVIMNPKLCVLLV